MRFFERMPKNVVYLSRRNLLTLLSKLDRKAAGEDTKCAIVKNRNPGEFQQTMSSILVVAVSDEEMYATRPAGEMHPSDEQNIPKPETGVEYAGPVM